MMLARAGAETRISGIFARLRALLREIGGYRPSFAATVIRQPATLLGLAAIAAAGMLLCWAVQHKYQQDRELALRNYRQHAHEEAGAVAATMREKLLLLHQGLRTISYLPGVRNIDRHGDTIDADAIESIQHLYNNLRSSVEVSELYIVPADFNPERIDPVTGAMQAPMLMFDELIVDAASLAREGRSERSFEEAFPSGVSEVREEEADEEEEEEEEEAREIEIFEYRVLREQAEWLAQHAPDTSSYSGFDRPMLSTPQVITCDNTAYIHTHNDADRSGTILSVPFYGVDGRFRGMVSAIMRTGVLQASLPSRHYALVNAAQGYVAASTMAGAQTQASAWVRRGEADPNLLYSETFEIGEFDPRGAWRLWVGLPDSAFLRTADLAGAREFRAGADAAILVLALIAAAALLLARMHLDVLHGHQRRMKEVADERSSRIEELTRAQAESAASKARAMHLAYHDVLTGLPNRAYVNERLAQAAEQLRRHGRTFSVHCLDLDRFKEINDTFGHAAGDELIRHAAKRLASVCRSGDVLARLGGDEFAILQMEASPDMMANLANRFVALMAEPFDLPMGRMHIGCSVGATMVTEVTVDAGEALRQADLALYRAKAAGRGCYALFELDMDAAVRTRRAMQERLREALARGTLDVAYQPQVDGSGQVVGVEALVRWFADGGAIPPSVFVPIAEECGLISALGEFVLRRAFQDSKAWPGVKTAINVSPPQFRMKDFVETVAALVAEYRVDPTMFELELTEGILLEDDPHIHQTLLRLRDLGFSLALDDFGTGYSSLSYLQRYPIDKIKIDRSFVMNLGADREADAVVEAIVQLAHALSLRVIAEGVETSDQRSRLMAVGCNDVQGYFFGKPMPRESVRDMVLRRAA